METILYMMVGIPASGKSYIAKTLNVPIVSSDAIRAELYGSEDDQSHNNEVFNEVHKRIRNYLLEGKSCVYDATNLSRKRRVGFLKEIPADVKKVAIIAATELEIILAQNAARERHVPEEVIMRMYKTMALPRRDEGWDQIVFQAHPKNSKTLGDYLYAAVGIDHDNPHHSADIFHHMLEASIYASSHAEDLDKESACIARNAALFHDIGKPVVKSRMKMNGEMDDKSHYYNHAEIGAYMMACTANQFRSEKQLNRLKSMIILTQWHMSFYEYGDSCLEKFEALYGGEMTKIFKLVHEADANAH